MEFTHTNESLKKIKILLLGSYQMPHFNLLERLKQFLKNNNLENTFLARDLVETPEEEDTFENLGFIEQKIEEIMKRFDFNIFLLYDERISEKTTYHTNESTITELTSLIHSNEFQNNMKQVLVCYPTHYYSSMLFGKIYSKKVNVFEYENEIQLFRNVFIYIKQNYLR